MLYCADSGTYAFGVLRAIKMVKMRLDILQAFTWLLAALMFVGVAAFLLFVSPLAILMISVVAVSLVSMFVLGMEAGRGRLRQVRVIAVKN
jgi:fatty acid desaturase